MNQTIHKIRTGILISLLFAVFTTCNQTKVPDSHSIEEQVERRKTRLLDSADRTYSHAEMWSIIEEYTRGIADSAALYQSEIESFLDDGSLSAYKTERDAFRDWYDYQSTVSSDVVVEIWQLYVGGSAGGTLEVMHLYDRANANLTEQEILYNALIKQAYAEHFQSEASMEKILSAKDSLIAAIKAAYSFTDNTDNWRSLDHSADEVSDYISRDFALFQKWIAARSHLEANLDPKVGSLFSSHTQYWMDLYLDTLRGSFIHEVEQ